MHRRYTIHRDGDLLVEDLGPDGKPLAPEAGADERKPIEITLLAPDDVDSKAALLDLLEMAMEMELNGEDPDGKPMKLKLDVIS